MFAVVIAQRHGGEPAVAVEHTAGFVQRGDNGLDVDGWSLDRLRSAHGHDHLGELSSLASLCGVVVRGVRFTDVRACLESRIVIGWHQRVKASKLAPMTSSDLWDQDTAKRYDDSSAEMFTPEVLDPAVDFLARLAGPGPALQFAIGTGRVAIPLAARGVPVTGVDLSQPMVDQLRRKIPAEKLPVVVGDMATTAVPGRFSLVYVVWNSIGNLRTQDEQVECFRNAARHLAPGGRFVIELWVPGIRRLPPGQSAVPFEVTDRHVGFDMYDLVTQRGTSHHYWRAEDGSTRYGFSNFRYIWPAECDLMARLAGMTLEQRVADWHGAAFTSGSESHVSVWRKDEDTTTA